MIKELRNLNTQLIKPKATGRLFVLWCHTFIFCCSLVGISDQIVTNTHAIYNSRMTPTEIICKPVPLASFQLFLDDVFTA